MSRPEAFWFNAQIRAATNAFRKQQAEQQQGTKAGTASKQEQGELVEQQDSRAKVADAKRQSGQKTPSMDAQLTEVNDGG